MNSDIDMNSNTEILNIARKFSEAVDEIKNNYPYLILPVKVWPNRSQYVGVKELICEHDGFLSKWRDRITKETLFPYGIALGRYFEWCKKKQPGDEILQNQLFKEIIELSSNAPAINTFLSDKAYTPAHLEKNVKVLVLNPLCAVPFNHSVLSIERKNNVKSNEFFSISYVEIVRRIKEKMLHDAKFHLGVACEHLLFPKEPGLIYAFVDFPKQHSPTSNDYQWALCLWTYNDSQNIIRKKLNSLLRRYIKDITDPDAHHAEDNSEKHDVNGKWGVLYDKLTKPCSVDDEAYALLKTCNSFMEEKLKLNKTQDAKKFMNNIENLFADTPKKKEEAPVDIMKNKKKKIKEWMNV